MAHECLLFWAVRIVTRVAITTAPGEEGQVAYGDGPMVRHPQTGQYRRTRFFVLRLGYSQKRFGSYLIACSITLMC